MNDGSSIDLWRTAMLAFLVLLLAGAGSGQSCGARDSEVCAAKTRCPRSEVVALSDFDPSEWGRGSEKLFLVESGDHDFLHHRQACSVEAAVRNAGKEERNAAFGGHFYCCKCTVIFLANTRLLREQTKKGRSKCSYSQLSYSC